MFGSRHRRARSRIGSFIALALMAGALVILPASPAFAAPTLTITPLTWDVIGLDSNRPQTATNPNTYVERFKVCNTDSSSTAPSAQVVWTWGTDNHSGQQKIDFVNGAGAATKTVTLGTVAASSCKIASYVVEVTQAKTSIGQYRLYSLAASATGATTVNLTGRELYVEALVSQARNAIIGTAWKSLGDGTNPCSTTTACSVYEGQRYQITLTGKTSTSYDQVQQFLTLPDNIMTIDSIKTTFATPSGTSVNQEYGDGCGWSGPTTTSSGTCDGSPLPQISGGKAGGNPIKTVYTVTILSNASGQAAASVYPMITDHSGSSFHYNSDAVGKKITVTPKKAADLSISKTHANSASSSAFIQNTTGTTSSGNRYVITITNNGPSATTGTITVTDTLPSALTIPASTTIASTGATFTNSTAATNGCPVTSAGASDVTSISCVTTTSIASGGTATLTLPIKVPSAQAKGQVGNTATVSISTGASDSVDTNSANNTSTDQATIAAAPDTDLILTNTHTGNFTRGGTATWSLVLKNDGPSNVTTPSIVDTLPAGITYTGFSGTNWSCGAVGQVVTCTSSQSLNSGISAATLQISGSVAASASDIVTNSATGSASGTDPNSLNNTDITDKAIVGQADVSLVISHTGSLTIPSSTGTMNFAVTNSGPDAAASPSVVFTLPAKLTYLSVNTSGWTCSGVPASPTTSQSQVVTCTRSTSLVSGATSTVNITVAVDSSAADATVFSVSGIACSGTVQTATVNGQTVYTCPVIGGSGFATYDSDTTNNSAEDSVQAYLPADVSVVITPSSSVTAGNNVVYTITVSNAGPNPATNPFFLLSLPTGFTCNTGTASACVGTLSAAYTTGGAVGTISTTQFDASCSTSAQEVTCVPYLATGTPTLANGQSFQATVTAATSSTTTPNGANTIPVIASADQGDTTTSNNSANVTTTITSGNVAPAVTVTFGGSSTTSVNESSTSTYTYAWTATDSNNVSSFVAACGDAGTKIGGDTITAGGTGTTSVSGTFVCKFDDGPFTSLVTVIATDAQGLVGTGTNTVTIANVAPTAVISAPSSVSTSTDFTVSLGTSADVSATDTSSGFTYAFDCGSGYGDFGTATSTTCRSASSAGSVTVKGTIKDKDGASTEYTSSVTITGPPTAADISASLSHTAGAGVDLTLSGQDTTGLNLTFSIVSAPATGSLGSITGTSCTGTTTKTCTATVHYSNPGGDTLGNTTFTYKATNTNSVNSNTATATVTRTNTAPTATATLTPTSPTTNSTLTATATKADADSDTTTVAYVWKITRSSNTCTVKSTSATATLTDTLDLSQSFATSSCSGASLGTTSPSKGDTVSVFVTPNDGHVDGTDATDSKSIGNSTPSATAQTSGSKVSTNEDANVVITLAGTDSDGDTLTPKVTSLPSNGSLYDGSGTGGHLISSGEATAGYVVTDGSGRVTFAPAANYNNGASAFGPSFTFTVSDGSASSAAATVEIDVNPVNDAPAAADSTISTSGGTVAINLVNITTDQETASASHVYKITALPASGTLKDGATVITAGALPYTMTNGTTVTYVQPANSNTNVSFTYSATDRGDPDNCGSVVAGSCTAVLTDTGVVSITVTNAAPSATAQSISTTEDTTSGTITLAGTDPESDTLGFKITGLPTNGTLKDGATTITAGMLPRTLVGALTYVPTANFNSGASANGDTFTFKSNDGFSDSSNATVTVDINPVNDTPNANATSIGSTTVLDLQTITDDVETADANLSYALVGTNGGATKGTVTIVGSNVTYVKTAGQVGTDSYTYRVTDRGDPDACGAVVAGACTATANSTAVVSVNLANTGPTATAQAVTATEDTSKLITLTGTDPDSDALDFRVTSLPSNGKLYKGNSTAAIDEITAASPGSPALLTGATVTFVPNANYNNGSGASGNTFNFTVTDATGSNTTSSAATVTIDVDPVNDTPTWDASVGMSATGSLDLKTVSADLETPDANLSYSIVTDGAKGTASLSGATLTYSQAPNKTGTDSVTVKVTDRGDPDNCGSVVAGSCTATANADKTVTITLVQTAPTATSQTGGTKVSTNEDTSKLITLAATDAQNDTLTFKITSQPANGKLYKGNSTAAIDEITGATSGTPVTLAGATVTFVPNADYNNGSSASGPSFTFTATDVSGSNTASSAATVDIDVDPVNDTPTWDASVGMSATGSLDLKSVSADLETADANLSYSIVTDGTKGTASLSGATLTYSQAPNKTGTDSVTVKVTDRGDPDNCGTVVAGSCTATANADKTVTITLVQTAPTATSQTGGTKVSTNEDTSKLITLAATDAQNDTLTFKITSQPANGKLYKGNSTAAIDEITGATSGTPVTLAGATVTFVPTADYNNGSSASGPTFTFTATDAQGSNTASSAATVDIDVDPVNDAPTWDATVSMASTSTLDLKTVSADQETADANLTYSIVTNGTKGTASLSGSTLSYTKNANETGSDTVTVRVTDRGDPDNCGTVTAGACTAVSTTNKSITISLGNNNPPTATVSLAPVNPKTNDTLTATATKSDPENDTVTLTYVWKVTKGTSTCTLKTTSASSSLTDTLNLGTSFTLSACTGTTLTNGTSYNPSKSDVITVVVTPNDGVVDGSTASDNQTVADTAPTADSQLTANSGGYSVAHHSSVLTTMTGADADGETVTFKIASLPAKGKLYLGTNTSGTALIVGDSVPTDGRITFVPNTPSGDEIGTDSFTVKAVAATVESSAATIDLRLTNSLPVISSISFSPASVISSTTTLTATPSSTDADSDTITHDYAWKLTRGGITCTIPPIGSSISFSASYARTSCSDSLSHDAVTPVATDTFSVTITPKDPHGSGTSMSKSTANAKPKVLTLTVVPDPPKTKDTLTATVTVEDEDHDPITVKYEWYVNGVKKQTTGFTSTLTDTYNLAPDGAGDLDNQISVKVTPFDTKVDGDFKKVTVQVANTIPTAYDQSLTAPSGGADKTVTLEGTDPDDQTLFRKIVSLPSAGQLFDPADMTTPLTAGAILTNHGEKVVYRAPAGAQVTNTFTYLVTDDRTGSVSNTATVGFYVPEAPVTSTTGTGTTGSTSTPEDPLQATVVADADTLTTVAAAGKGLEISLETQDPTVSISEANNSEVQIEAEIHIQTYDKDGGGNRLPGTEADYTAPTYQDAFTFDFIVDGGLVPIGVTKEQIRVYRTSASTVELSNCPSTITQNSDLPCIYARARSGSNGDVTLTIKTLGASLWNFVVPAVSGAEPNTTIVSGPSGAINPTRTNGTQILKFGYSANQSPATFRCELVRNNSGVTTVVFAEADCTTNSEIEYDVSGVPDDLYTFYVKSKNTTSNLSDPTPAKRDVVIDRTSPIVTITSGPAHNGTITVGSATFDFTVDDTFATLRCKMDSGVRVDCQSGTVSYSNLSAGTHTFIVEATDSASNVGNDIRTFTVNLPGSGGGAPAPSPSGTLPIAVGETDIRLFSPNGDGKLDSIIFTGTINKPTTWKLVFVKASDPDTPVMTATGQGDSATGVWDGMDENGDPLPDGVYEWVLTGTDAAGNAFPAVSGTVILDKTPPPITRYSLFDKPGKASGAELAFHVGEASTVTVQVVCGGEVVKGFGPVTLADPQGGEVEFGWPGATEEQINKIIANKCRVVITAVDKVFNAGELKPLEQKADRLPGPHVMLYTNESPIRGTSITFYTRLQHCEGHEHDLIELWRLVGDHYVKISQTHLDGKCRATFTLPADFDKAEFRTIWPKQDDDHRRGRAEPVVVVPRSGRSASNDTTHELPGPHVKLFASKETPVMGDEILLHTRLGRCEGHEGDRIKLLRKLPGEDRFTKIAVKRVHERCKAVFKITADFARAEFRTVWPQQDPAFREGKSEPVVIVTRQANGSASGGIDPQPTSTPPPSEQAVLPEPTPSSWDG